MAQKTRLGKKVLQEDKETLAALKAIAGYTPNNALYSIESLIAAEEDMIGGQTEETQRQAALDATRDSTVDKEYTYHNRILGAKTQIAAQFGEDSNEYQSTGRKKKSEYNRGRPSAAKTSES